MSLFPRSDAVISPCGRYRYRLSRTWSDTPPLVVCGVNPSTADATQDDPTIRRCIGFARSAGYGGLVMVNVFALRSTDVKALASDPDPWGPETLRYVLGEAIRARGIVLAWGSPLKVPRALRGAFDEIAAELERSEVPTYALRLTVSGHPEHPLYLPATCQPRRIHKLATTWCWRDPHPDPRIKPARRQV